VRQGEATDSDCGCVFGQR